MEFFLKNLTFVAQSFFNVFIMAKSFNITGVCSPKKHYMADVSPQLEATFAMIEKGEYFIINRPRQYGKTTMLYNFQAFMKKEYSSKDRTFLEREGRMIFLAFMRPILNGAGYDFKELQVSEEKRLDVVITYHQHLYVAELKIWHGEEAHQKGLAQLADYLDSLGLETGYLLIFDHNKKKTWKKDWIMSHGKRIFWARV